MVVFAITKTFWHVEVGRVIFEDVPSDVHVTITYFNLDAVRFPGPKNIMATKRINHRQPHDSVLAEYNNFLNNSKLDENGNPFSETLVRVSQLPDWTLTKYRQLVVSATEGGNPLRHKVDGPPSLWDVTRRFLNNNLKNLTVEALEAVPWELMKYIWADALTT